jgi:ribonuclease Z
MQLTVLGAGTGVPVIARSPAGYLLETGQEKLVFDMGPGTLWRLLAAGVSHEDINHIFVSHLHSDHVLDLITFLQASGGKRANPLDLIGCLQLKDFMDKQIAIFDVAPEGFALRITELAADRREYSFGVIETILTGHTSNSIGFRLESEHKTFVYSGDAVESEALCHLARDADIFVCECSFPRGWKTADHITADGAGRMAQLGHARRLILTHLYPPALAANVAKQASEFFEGEIIVAKDGTVCVA